MLAKELVGELQRQSRRLFLLPFNRYAPQATEWWLTPTPERTAYPYGKIALFGYEDGIFVGFYVEKGFGPSVAMVDQSARSRGWLVDETWLWPSALISMQDGSLAKAADDVAARSGLDTRVLVNVIPFEPRGEPSDPKARPPRARMRWGLRNGRLTKFEEETRAAFEEARQLWSATSLPELAAQLRTLPRQDWLWVDLYIGVVLGRPKEPAGPAKWDAGAVIHCCVAPWFACLRRT